MATDVNIQSATIGTVPISGHVVVDTGSIAIGNAVTIANFPPLQPVSGTITIANFPVLQPVSIQNPLPLSISGSVDILNLPAIQPITGAVTVLNFPAVLPTTVANFPALQSVSVSNFPPLQPVTGVINIANFPALQPISVVGGVDILDRVGRSLGHVVVDSAPPVTFPSSIAVSNFPATQPVSIAAPVAVTGTFFQPVQPVSFAAQVRQGVMLSWERLAGVAAESALTNFTNGSLNAVALPAASIYQVSAGKTFRITQINIALRLTANNVVNTRVRLRQSGAVTNASPIIWQGELGTTNTANAAEIEYSQTFTCEIEIAAGQQITITHLESSAVGTVSVVLVGYEY